MREMTDKITDHEARAMADRANQRLDAHEEFCKERVRRAETFEADMRRAMKDLGGQITSMAERVHSRINLLVRGALYLSLAIIISGVGWALVQGITGP